MGQNSLNTWSVDILEDSWRTLNIIRRFEILWNGQNDRLFSCFDWSASAFFISSNIVAALVSFYRPIERLAGEGFSGHLPHLICSQGLSQPGSGRPVQCAQSWKVKSSRLRDFVADICKDDEVKMPVQRWLQCGRLSQGKPWSAHEPKPPPSPSPPAPSWSPWLRWQSPPPSCPPSQPCCQEESRGRQASQTPQYCPATFQSQKSWQRIISTSRPNTIVLISRIVMIITYWTG